MFHSKCNFFSDSIENMFSPIFGYFFTFFLMLNLPLLAPERGLLADFGPVLLLKYIGKESSLENWARLKKLAELWLCLTGTPGGLPATSDISDSKIASQMHSIRI